MSFVHFVIKKGTKYVAKPGSQHSYVDRLQDAKIYDDLESARLDACENEQVVQLGLNGGVR